MIAPMNDSMLHWPKAGTLRTSVSAMRIIRSAVMCLGMARAICAFILGDDSMPAMSLGSARVATWPVAACLSWVALMGWISYFSRRTRLVLVLVNLAAIAGCFVRKAVMSNRSAV